MIKYLLTEETEAGRKILAEHPESSGSLGIAISEAVEVALKAGLTFARCEGILPAPEANHAVKGAIDEALHCKECKEEGISRTILFNLCGHGHFDMQAYIDYQSGLLQDIDP